MEEQPSSADAFAQQVFYFIERRRLADARRVLKDGLTQFPQDPDLLFYSAQVEWLGDENAAAETTARQVLSVAPEHAPARRLLADLLIEREQFADAEGMLIGLLRDYPEDAHLYGHYSRLMLRTLHLDKAEQLAREGLRYGPDDVECLLAMALCETARGGSQANQGLEKLIQGHPESMNTVHALVVALVDSGRVKEAHVIAQQAMRADPANEHLVETVRELRIQSHWSMKLLWPLQKWGWGGSAVIWVGAIFVMRVLQNSAPAAYGPFVFTWLAYVVYSWVWPSLIRRIL
ncbi:MAG TPA: tetratricopeptide repeat protein [Steroidobacteraceae bacterium]|nr:tetratricopeptide repeat protein [Steroidobacteraceae bacterium]